MKIILDKTYFQIYIDEIGINFKIHQQKTYVITIDNKQKICEFLDLIKGKSNCFIIDNFMISIDYLMGLNIRIGDYTRTVLEFPILINVEQRNFIYNNINALL